MSWSLKLRIPPLEFSFVSKSWMVKIPLTGTGICPAGTARFSGSLVYIVYSVYISLTI